MKDIAKYSDKELLNLLHGDKNQAGAAFAEIYDRYSLKVNAYCMSILNNKEQAEDVFQETFLKFYQNAQPERIQKSVIGYLITIARNLCINANRDKKNTIPIEEFHFPVKIANEYEDKELSELISIALDLLSDNYKEVIVLKYFDGLKYDDIGDILGITASRARYLVFIGKQKLKKILAPYFKGIYF